jgi:NAD(P)-dependent dehydrogenase (short-subunit alcohol dehydrogenase family)
LNLECDRRAHDIVGRERPADGRLTVDFAGRVALVSGAGRGLGAAYARLLAARGAAVVVHDAGLAPDGTRPDPRVAQAVSDEIDAAGGTAFAIASDLALAGACDELVAETVSRFGGLHALVHSAGLVLPQRIEETSDEELARLQAVNCDAAFRLCRAAFPVMRARGHGRIVLTTSGHALEYDPAAPATDLAAYCLGKGAQLGLAIALAAEGAADGILVNAVSPAAKTRMMRREVEPGRWTPEHVAGAVVWLASPRCELTGWIVRVGDGRIALAALHDAVAVELGDAAADPDRVEEALRATEVTG